MIKKLVGLCLCVCILSSCSHSSKVVLEGNVKGFDNSYVKVSQVQPTGVVLMDSVLVKEGHFQISWETKNTEPVIYRLDFPYDHTFATIATQGDQLLITADATDFMHSYSVTGNDDALLMCELDHQLAFFSDSIEHLEEVYGAYIFDDSIRAMVGKVYTLIKEHHTTYLKNFITTHPQSLASVVAFYQRYTNKGVFLPEKENILILQNIYDQLSKKYPNNEYVIWIGERLEKLVNHNLS